MKKNSRSIRAPVITLPDTVLFPWTLTHIEISDQAHLKIIKDALKNGSNIVITLRKDPFAPRNPFSSHINKKMNQIGTIGRPIVIDESDHGYTKVIFKGQERVIIKELIQNLPYPIYELELCPDSNLEKNEKKIMALSPGGNAHIERLANLLHNWGERNIQDSLDRDNFFSSLENINHLINNISTHLIDDSEIKQILLETLDISERIQILSLLFPSEMVDREDPMASQALKEYESIESKMIKSQ